jgi:hypothetical protein
MKPPYQAAWLGASPVFHHLLRSALFLIETEQGKPCPVQRDT